MLRDHGGNESTGIALFDQGAIGRVAPTQSQLGFCRFPLSHIGASVYSVAVAPTVTSIHHHRKFSQVQWCINASPMLTATDWYHSNIRCPAARACCRPGSSQVRVFMRLSGTSSLTEDWNSSMHLNLQRRQGLWRSHTSAHGTPSAQQRTILSRVPLPRLTLYVLQTTTITSMLLQTYRSGSLSQSAWKLCVLRRLAVRSISRNFHEMIATSAK